MMSTNGILTEKIEDVMPYYDSIQITAKPGSKRIEKMATTIPLALDGGLR